MKRIFILLGLIVIGLCSSVHAFSDNVLKYQVSYPSDNLKITTVDADNGKKYSLVQMKDLCDVHEPGLPIFPINQIDFSVPYTATNFKIAVRINEEKEIHLPYPPLPAQPDHYAETGCKSYADKEDFMELIPLEDYTAPPVAQIITDLVFGGLSRILTVRISPIRWEEHVSKIKVLEKLEIEIKWTTDTSLLDNINGPRTQVGLQGIISRTKSKVVNPEDVEKNSAYYLRMRSLLKSVIPTGVDIPYLIVTTKELAASMERLAAMRRLRGINTEVVCIEDILSDPENDIGDYVSGIADDAGKLRGFLKRHRNGNKDKMTGIRQRDGKRMKSKLTEVDPEIQLNRLSGFYIPEDSTGWKNFPSNPACSELFC